MYSILNKFENFEKTSQLYFILVNAIAAFCEASTVNTTTNSRLYPENEYARWDEMR